MHASAPARVGSSISHWTTAATPNLLMEPSIKRTLTDDLDLSTALMVDIGWVVLPTPCTDDADCEDGLFCTGVETCDSTDPGVGADGCVDDPNLPNLCCKDNSMCGPALPRCDLSTNMCVECLADNDDDGNVCTDEVCVAGMCETVAVNEGGACDDGDPTTFNDVCVNGTCVGSTDVDPPVVVHAQDQVAPASQGNTGLSAVSIPCTGYIDPRMENVNIGGVDTELGPKEIIFVFSEPVSAMDGGPVNTSSFAVSPDLRSPGAPPPNPPVVALVEQLSPTTYRVVLDRIIDFPEWTTVQAVVKDLAGNPITNLGNLGAEVDGTPITEPDRTDIGRLPGDVDQNTGCRRPIF